MSVTRSLLSFGVVTRRTCAFHGMRFVSSIQGGDDGQEKKFGIELHEKDATPESFKTEATPVDLESGTEIVLNLWQNTAKGGTSDLAVPGGKKGYRVQKDTWEGNNGNNTTTFAHAVREPPRKASQPPLDMTADQIAEAKRLRADGVPVNKVADMLRVRPLAIISNAPTGKGFNPQPMTGPKRTHRRNYQKRKAERKKENGMVYITPETE